MTWLGLSTRTVAEDQQTLHVLCDAAAAAAAADAAYRNASIFLYEISCCIHIAYVDTILPIQPISTNCQSFSRQ